MCIPSFDDASRVCSQTAVDGKIKSLGALSRLESLIVQIGLIQNIGTSQLTRPVMVVFTISHGIAHTDVNAYPQAVTAQMVLNSIAGGATANAFRRQHGLVLEVVNADVAAPLWATDAPGLIDAPVGPGTRNSVDESVEQATMIIEERDRAMALGA